MALPSLRIAGGVRAGISATTGALQRDIVKTKRMMKSIVSGSELLRATHGITPKRKAEIGAPKTMNGRRLPSLEWQLSESLPKVGWKITPKMLSKVIIIPMKSGTSVIPPPARLTSSPCASANFARTGNISLSFALHAVIVADSVRSRLRIFVI